MDGRTSLKQPDPVDIGKYSLDKQVERKLEILRWDTNLDTPVGRTFGKQGCDTHLDT